MVGKVIKKKYELNSISSKTNMVFNILFSIYCIACLAPLLLIFMVSITDEVSLVENGYSFFPSKISFSAYQYLFMDFEKILRAYGVTIGVCVIGTVLSVLLTMLFAYPISRKSFKYRNFFSFYIFFTMLFQGGLVPWYILYTRYLRLEDSLLALILPPLVTAFNVLVVKTYLAANLPEAILESARIDGASEFRIFFSIVIPLSVPVIATIGLFSVLAYWNDWYLCLLYIRSPKNYNIQYSMYQALRSIEFLTSSNVASLGNTSSELLKVPGETLRMAMAIIGIGPIVFAYPFFQKYFIKGLTIGAVKG
ncbi:UNVERIFIED_CONTAM: putative aldouronate transport system permease protein [Acetivibrio alkalicellulosi]